MRGIGNKSLDTVAVRVEAVAGLACNGISDYSLRAHQLSSVIHIRILQIE